MYEKPVMGRCTRLMIVEQGYRGEGEGCVREGRADDRPSSLHCVHQPDRIIMRSLCVVHLLPGSAVGEKQMRRCSCQLKLEGRPRTWRFFRVAGIERDENTELQ